MDRPLVSSALRVRVRDPGTPTPPAAVSTSLCCLLLCRGSSRAQGSPESANHIPKDEQPVAAPSPLKGPPGPLRPEPPRLEHRSPSEGADGGGRNSLNPSSSPNFASRRSSSPSPLRHRLLPLSAPPRFWFPLRNPPAPPHSRSPAGRGSSRPPRAAAAARVPLPPPGRSLPSP